MQLNIIINKRISMWNNPCSQSTRMYLADHWWFGNHALGNSEVKCALVQGSAC
jgi:hypothetical protein